jgi:competence protein ComEC
MPKISFWIWILLVLAVITRLVTSQAGFKNGQNLRISGRVLSEPRHREGFDRVSFGAVSVLVPSNFEAGYGDYMIVEGRYKDGQVNDAKVISISRSSFFVFPLREAIINFYNSNLPQPYAGLIGGIVIGSKGGLGKTFADRLRAAGTTHVVVASGMNVTLIAGFLFSVALLFLNRPKAIALSLIGIWFYVALAGVEAPVVRAAFMGSIAGVVQMQGKPKTTLGILCLTALLMLLLFPWWVSDVGFWLSFGATSGLVVFDTKIDRLIYFIPPIIRENLATTLAASVGAAPVLLLQFGKVTPLALVTNPLVLWTISTVTILGAIAACAGLVLPLIGKVILICIYPLLLWFVFIVELFT